MARYDHLPIFADAYQFALLVEQLVGNFSNKARAALGADLRQQSQHILRCIIQVNSLALTERYGVLQHLNWRVEETLILLRLAKDTRALPNLKAYEQCANLLY